MKRGVIEDVEDLRRELRETEIRLHDVATLCATVEQERDALLADNERLRGAVDEALRTYKIPRTARICEAMIATPAQSLARLRNQVRDECATAGGPEDSYQDEWFKAKADSAARILATKEPE